MNDAITELRKLAARYKCANKLIEHKAVLRAIAVLEEMK
jgi:hypothetical protein